MWNTLGHYKVFIPICAAFLLLSLYYLEHKYKFNIGIRIYGEQKPQFRELKKNGIHTFSNVCIEELTTPKLENRLRLIFNETKKIVIYGDNSQADGARITIRVAGSGNSLWNHWEIHFQQQVLPPENKRYLRDTVFFVQPTCPGNFHHFIIDEFIPLYSVVVLSNRLHLGARNQILYRTPQFSVEGNRCFSKRTYEGFLRTLYIDDFHDVFYNLPNNTCFRQAVFGSTPLLFRQRDVIDHVLRYYNLTLHSNRNANDLYVTLLGRKDRRIINAEEVLSFAKEVGFKNLRIVDFANKSINYQLEIMSTSNVFIGIQGAGLQWSMFMPEGSYLIELAWPQKHWGFYYGNFVPPFGITWRGVGVQDVRLNWTSYATNVRHGVPVSEAEKPILIKGHPKDPTDNIWKWCDIVVQKNEQLYILLIVSAIGRSFSSLFHSHFTMCSYYIRSKLNGLVLDVEWSKSSPGALVSPWKKNGTDAQIWYDDPATGTIRSKLNGYCMDIEGGRLVLNPYQAGKQDQLWKRKGSAIVDSCDKVLDICESDEKARAKVIKFSAHGGSNQSWTFELV